MKAKKSETSPIHSLSSELTTIEKAFHHTLRAYTQRVKNDLEHIVRAVEALQENKKISKTHFHDLRDMLMLARSLEIKPAKGRRRDLKRIESLLDDLGRFVADWEATRPKEAQPALEAAKSV